jgi:hypothetical protein
VPGLLQAIRAGNVLVANAPGSAFLAVARPAGLPAARWHRQVLGEDSSLPGPAHLVVRRTQRPWTRCCRGWASCTIKPTYPGSSHPPEFRRGAGSCRLGPARNSTPGPERILRQSEAHTVQAYLPRRRKCRPGSPAARPGGLARWRRRSADAAGVRGLGPTASRGWRVLPGGLARVAGAGADIASMQQRRQQRRRLGPDPRRGGQHHPAATSADHAAPCCAQRKRLVTSRAAENLYWLGRYTERAENAARLAAR